MLVKNVVDEFESNSKVIEKNIKFKIIKEKPNGYDFQLFGIDNRLEQILANLLDNALSFSPNKGQVSIYIKGKKDTVSFSVKDQGPGFSGQILIRYLKDFIAIDLRNLVNTQVWD